MERRREGNRRRDRHDGVTDRQRERETRETEWGLQLQNVRISLQDEEAKKKINQFPQCWHTRTNTLHGALQSALCMKHSVTYVASVLSAASVTGHRWQWPSSAPLPQAPYSWEMWSVMTFHWQHEPSVNTWQHVFKFLRCPICGPTHMGVGRGIAMVMWRMDVCMVYMKRSGLGTYCGSNITETLEQKRRQNPRIVNKALSDCRRKLSVQTPKPLPPFPLPHTHSRLALTHCVSSSNSLHSLPP